MTKIIKLTPHAMRRHFERDRMASVTSMAAHYGTGYSRMLGVLLDSGLTKADLLRRAHQIQHRNVSNLSQCLTPDCQNIVFATIKEMCRVPGMKRHYFNLYVSMNGYCPPCHNAQIKATVPPEKQLTSSQLLFGDSGLTLSPKSRTITT